MASDRRRQKGPGDRGITVVLFAIGISALLTVGALVLGAGVGYSAARDTQTAADAAALAGASLLQNHKQDWIETDATDVYAEIESVAADNGATLVRCDLILASYALTGADADVSAPCEDLADLTDDQFQAVAGVRVTVSETRDVAFSSFLDRDDISARATASATIQPVATGSAPFMVCAFAEGHPADLLVEDATDRTGYIVNDAAVDKLFVLWGNHIKYLGRDCGNNSSDWRGLLDYDSLFGLGAWWGIEDGNKNGVGVSFEPMIAGNRACYLGNEKLEDLKMQIGCQVALPLCIEGRDGASGFELRCVKMGVFEISHVGDTFDETDAALDPEAVDYDTPCGVESSNIVCGKFVGAATAAVGRGYAAPPDRHEFAVIKLVE